VAKAASCWNAAISPGNERGNHPATGMGRPLFAFAVRNNQQTSILTVVPTGWRRITVCENCVGETNVSRETIYRRAHHLHRHSGHIHQFPKFDKSNKEIKLTSNRSLV
tara:strand:+ start:63 stop:386 length:324 start_codon:yes stop_codon:yes gene_type:complete